jgi:hypothetical protein
MLVQDTLTGAVHEVPESQLYEADYAESPEQMAEGQILYDGLGNPVGFSFLKKAFRAASRLAPLASRLAPLASLLPVPGAGLLTQAAQRVLPGVIRQLAPAARNLQRVLPPGMVQQFAPVAQAFQQAVPAAAPPGTIGGFYGEAVPAQPIPAQPTAEQPMPAQALQPPPGWIPRPSPYLGRKGRRVYMRCVLWRGPKGLVPAVAAQTPPAPAVVAQTIPPGPVVVAPAVVGRRFGRRRRR